ncbi:hypothetical protein [Brevibacterium album]|uniref:hypothetical protein n=1 Tax=Brevibacterium album TaxID=417948 RepID=UPI00048CC2A7|nr:hypothetical protein [Brevibacterium album]
MALDPVPWFIGGAAEHSAEAARQQAWSATQGRTGVSTPSSLLVSATPTPSGSVRISAGGAAMESTYQGASQQSYTVRNGAMITVPVPANNSSSTVTRIVGIEVRDPQYMGAYPPDREKGPYVFASATLPAFSSGFRHPYVLLATIRMPANTSVVTNAMITDARELLNPRREEVVHARPRVAADDSNQNFLTGRRATGGEYFPGGAGYANEFTTRIPTWATMMIIESGWLSVRMDGNQSSWGNFWIEYGDEYRPHTWPNKQQWEFATQHFSWDVAENSAVYRNNWLLADTRTVPSKLKGKDTTFVYKAAISDSTNAASRAVSCDSLSGLTTRITFIEAPDGTWHDAN